MWCKRLLEDRSRRWVITDAPQLAFLAGRRVPPPLVDTSEARIRAGALGAELAIDVLRDYDVDTVVLWTGQARGLWGPSGTLVDRELILVEAFGEGSTSSLA